MTSQVAYNKFISDCRAKPVPAGYIENHHILPVSYGGKNGKNNLIPLSAEDHFLAHYLLMQVEKEKYGRKMHNAFREMCGRHPFHSSCGMTLDEAAELFGRKRRAANARILKKNAYIRNHPVEVAAIKKTKPVAQPKPHVFTSAPYYASQAATDEREEGITFASIMSTTSLICCFVVAPIMAIIELIN